MRAISAFEAAARHECFAAAAKELNLTQSAISHSIRGLEAQIGAQLFTRRGPHLQLTPQGRMLAERMRAGLQLLAEALHGVTGVEAGEGLVVAASGALPQRALMARAPRLQVRRPGVPLALRFDLEIGAVQSGAADVCLVQGEAQGAGLRGRLLAREAVFPVIAPSRRADVPRFPEMDLIENTEHSWADWHGHWRTPFSVRTPQLTTGDWGMALEGARAGLGVALSCQSLAAEDLASGRLLRIGVQEMPCRAGCYAFWRPTSAKCDAILALLDDWDASAPSDPLDEQAARGLLHARV